MQVWIDLEEYWPVYEIPEGPCAYGTIELSEEELARVQAVFAEWHQVQELLAKRYVEARITNER